MLVVGKAGVVVEACMFGSERTGLHMVVEAAGNTDYYGRMLRSDHMQRHMLLVARGMAGVIHSEGMQQGIEVAVRERFAGYSTIHWNPLRHTVDRTGKVVLFDGSQRSGLFIYVSPLDQLAKGMATYRTIDDHHERRVHHPRQLQGRDTVVPVASVEETKTTHSDYNYLHSVVGRP